MPNILREIEGCKKTGTTLLMWKGSSLGERFGLFCFFKCIRLRA